MSVVLVNVANGPSNVLENLGIGAIASFLRKNNIEPTICYLGDTLLETEANKLPLKNNLFGFSMVYTNVDFIFLLAKYIKMKNPNASVFVGGRLATDAATEILNDCEYIDFVVSGFGEQPVFEVINAINSGNDISDISGIVTRLKDNGHKMSTNVNINNLPWPSRDYLELFPNNVVARINASIGCCGSCTFCSVNSFYSKDIKRWQGREMEDVFNEIRLLHENYGIRMFIFNDGSLEDPGVLGKSRIERLCDLIIEYKQKLSFRCYLRAETFSECDIPLIKKMRKAGFTQVFIGIESGSTQDLILFNKKATINDNHRAIKLFEDNGINVIMGFIPIHSLSNGDTLKENFNFLYEHKAYDLLNYATPLEVYYGTPIHKELEKQGLIHSDFSYKNPHAYVFKDYIVENVYEFINKHIGKDSNIIKDAYEFAGIVHTFNGLTALYPDEIVGFQEELKEIKIKLHKLISDFFRHIYIDNDLDFAYKNVTDFQEKLNALYQSAGLINLRLIKKKPFRSFFIK